MSTRTRIAAAALMMYGAHASAASVAVVVHDSGGKALPDVAVYAEPDGAAAPKAVRAGEIEQRALKFMPLVTVIQVGNQIAFPNNDKVRHHIYSFSPAHKFDQKLYAGVAAAPQVFDKPGTVVLGCNIHDKMLAYVRVVETPYYGKTDAAGAVKIELPAGKYMLKAWHYHAVGGQAAEQALTVKAGDTPAAATFKITLKPPAADGDNAAAESASL
ncbi:MAG: methylamine utilization protein [Pseudomonadota bacterium]